MWPGGKVIIPLLCSDLSPMAWWILRLWLEKSSSKYGR